MIQIPILYTKKMWCDSGHLISPSSKKPKFFSEAAKKLESCYIMGFYPPLIREDFYRVHDKKFVDGIFDLTIPNGFETISKDVSDTLYWTSGSMFHACKVATNNGKMAIAPVSGFHHAGYDFPMGFCTFNGLMVSAVKLMDEQPHIYKKIAIIDCDAHYGNGTDDIIQELSEKRIYHNTFGKKFPCVFKGQNEPVYTPKESMKYLEEFKKVRKDLEKFKPDLIIYQAGADPHINDPYGGILTTEQMYQRDVLMFTISKELNIPIAWNLAGGYQVDENGDISKVLELHLNTVKAAVSVY
jgi:acetoin utilization deacetylase AcuC-like enzyme